MGTMNGSMATRTLGDFFTTWLDGHSLNIRPATLANYRMIGERFLVPNIGAVALEALSPMDVQGVISNMAKRGHSARMRQMAYIVLKAALATAVKWGLVAKNAADGVAKPRVEKKEMTVWTAQQARRFLEVTEGTEEHALYVLALTLGARQGELLGLQWEDVDLEGRTLRIRQQLSEVGGQIVGLAPVKTARGNRDVSLSDKEVAALTAHQKMTRRVKGFVFLKDGEPRKKADIHYVFKRDTKKARLPEIRFHDLRHTNVTLLISKGVDAKTIQGRVGHSSIGITLDTYAKFLKAADQQAALAVGEMFA